MERQLGKFRGTVTDNNDPNNQGRVKASVPAVLQNVDTGWALPAVPYAGPGVGTWAIPPVGAGVWIEFEGGDVAYPIWTGCWWAGNQRPQDQNGTKAVPTLKVLRSEDGLIVALDDDGHTISISDQNGSNYLVITVDQGTVKIEASTKVVVDAPIIQLVENSTHPLVFGDDLLTYLNQLVTLFNTHVHPGEMALGTLPVTPMIPAVPFPPAEPSLLSEGDDRMTMRAGTVADWGGMAAAIEQAFGDELAARKGTQLPDATADERRMLFAAIARGVLGYLHDNESAMTIFDGTDSFPLQIDYMAESEQSP